MNVELFDYNLPKEMVAQFPEREREQSRLLCYNRESGSIEHKKFTGIVDCLHEGDVLVLNNSRVWPARIGARKKTGGHVDILLTEKLQEKQWRCLVRGAKRGISQLDVVVAGTDAVLTRDELSWIVEFRYEGEMEDFFEYNGKMPLPPYIKRKNDGHIDFERYQTVYAENTGSIAAPTAGFHFTESLLQQIMEKGIEILKITLHIGTGTFSLIKTTDVEDHSMHREFYSVPPDTIERIRNARTRKKRIVACGTSATRTLESLSFNNGGIPDSGYTELFIYPGYTFKVVDAMITNFHLPRSTPLMLAVAFAGRDGIHRCYREAIERGYRFYSYGDAMFIA